MRIAFFDGILESHVASSLQRSFERLGHSVLNTGKFGSGFEFRVERRFAAELRQIIETIEDFRPDWIIVFRPGSAPHQVLRALRGTGAHLATWFSDDPVLFNLSYGPVVDEYDIVMHCGRSPVLRFYESVFGRPTGVNIPFWTDHTAFPFVYGTNQPETTAMFLGNVHDRVRRARYFDLAKMTNSVRVHGAVATDYFNLSGGYLDTDEEVVDAGSRARIALNIPQFFKNHRGLSTWFPGLDELGFFEYPSRVIQYAAMGLPIVSIIPGFKQSRSFPEIIFSDSIADADAVISRLVRDEALDELSHATRERFDSSFSADSRALAMIDLFTRDSWSTLDADEREIWFTQFDGRSVASLSSADMTDISTYSADIEDKLLLTCESPTDTADSNHWDSVDIIVDRSGSDHFLECFGSAVSALSAITLRYTDELEECVADSDQHYIFNLSRFLRTRAYDLDKPRLVFLGLNISITKTQEDYALAHNVTLMSPVAAPAQFSANHGKVIRNSTISHPRVSKTAGSLCCELPYHTSHNMVPQDINKIVVLSAANATTNSKALTEEFLSNSNATNTVQIESHSIEIMPTAQVAQLLSNALVLCPVVKSSNRLTYAPAIEAALSFAELVVVPRESALAENDDYSTLVVKASTKHEVVMKVRRILNRAPVNPPIGSDISVSDTENLIHDLFAATVSSAGIRRPPTKASMTPDGCLAVRSSETVDLGDFVNADRLGNACILIELKDTKMGDYVVDITASGKVTRSIRFNSEQCVKAEISGISATQPDVAVRLRPAEHTAGAFASLFAAPSMVVKNGDPSRIVGVQRIMGPRIACVLTNRFS
ncbi:MAG: glycosyltransferase [Arcanobacterium sp.]|nr:glycosyltransferase [Arcanobacterium sp.]MDY6143090.1 glycosyltransferase [Arcanobacterium sp.]